MTGGELILGQSLFEWLSVYGYLIIIPIAVFEGTAIAFVAGAMASIGVFNPFILFAILVGIRFIMDTIVYLSALHGASFLKRFKLFKKVVEKIRGEDRGEIIKAIDKHFVLSLFLAKVLPVPSADTTLLISAGIMKIKMKKVYLAIFTGQPIWTATMIALGFFFADTLQHPKQVINILGFSFGFLIVLYILYSKYVHNYLIEKTKIGKLFKNGE